MTRVASKSVTTASTTIATIASKRTGESTRFSSGSRVVRATSTKERKK